MLKEIAKSLANRAGFRITRNYFGIDKWQDVTTILGRDPEIIFDVGANVGQTATALVKCFRQCKIHSFEPFPSSFAALKEVVAGYENVLPRNLALGSEPGNQRMYTHPGSEWNSMLKVSGEIETIPNSDQWTVSRVAEAIEVPVSTIDSYCSENGIDVIDLLKIDTQGYELAVLRGAREMLRAKRIGVVFMEMNMIPLYEGQPSFEQLYSYMKDVGYRLSGLYDRCFSEDRAIMWCDGLFVA